jgi:hypothetical protein
LFILYLSRFFFFVEGFPLIKEYGVTHTTIVKITDAAGIAKDELHASAYDRIIDAW